ncbi:sensor histidine kinase [Tautonia plasticadhaerens]|uniref:histidine kinase n=1 Tax=Tautonia plasticadhaerens TaxID=2527974 RepID=A0A518H0X3_9BACT|nr:ATP-binding protein [Tautonia plasticadhaerens]QDV34481.1 Sensor protein ZraS [Tautonia plasticadhaerens]
MQASKRPRTASGRIALGCGVASATLATAALIGWATGRPALMGIREDYIPMAPNTALGFLTLGIALVVSEGGAAPSSAWRRRYAGASALLAGAVCALRFLEFVSRYDFGVDRWFLQVPAEVLDLAPVGEMAFTTAAAFLASSVGLGMLAIPRPLPAAGHAAGICGLSAGAMGLVFALGYLYSPNAPLLYGSGTIPMALNTAVGFLLLGGGLVASAGPRSFPLDRFSGPSVRSRLMRAFLPPVAATVCLVAWLTPEVSRRAGGASSALSSAALATAATVVFGVICGRIASHVGGQIDRVEDELRRARDDLEVKVAGRTAELRRAFDELSVGHEALRRAHDELQQAQGRMLEQAKMASLGQTAAGVAHEINNPLAFVSSNMFVLRREVASLHDVLCLYREAEQTLAQYRGELHARIRDLCEQVDLPYVLDNLDRILDRSTAGLKRIQKIVEDLRDFARIDDSDFQDADLNTGIVATLNIMQCLADRQGVSLKSDLRPLPRVVCYPAKVNLVVQNLVSNAVDACPPGGEVVVSTRAAEGAVEIAVADTGSGIDPSLREKIFEPFFTTKPIGQGTGLGLSMSYGIVRDHGGSIAFEPVPGGGSRFTVILPEHAVRPMTPCPAPG